MRNKKLFAKCIAMSLDNDATFSFMPIPRGLAVQSAYADVTQPVISAKVGDKKLIQGDGNPNTSRSKKLFTKHIDTSFANNCTYTIRLIFWKRIFML